MLVLYKFYQFILRFLKIFEKSLKGKLVYRIKRIIENALRSLGYILLVLLRYNEIQFFNFIFSIQFEKNRI